MAINHVRDIVLAFLKDPDDAVGWPALADALDDVGLSGDNVRALLAFRAAASSVNGIPPTDSTDGIDYSVNVSCIRLVICTALRTVWFLPAVDVELVVPRDDRFLRHYWPLFSVEARAAVTSVELHVLGLLPSAYLKFKPRQQSATLDDGGAFGVFFSHQLANNYNRSKIGLIDSFTRSFETFCPTPHNITSRVRLLWFLDSLRVVLQNEAPLLKTLPRPSVLLAVNKEAVKAFPSRRPG